MYGQCVANVWPHGLRVHVAVSVQWDCARVCHVCMCPCNPGQRLPSDTCEHGQQAHVLLFGRCVRVHVYVQKSVQQDCVRVSRPICIPGQRLPPDTLSSPTAHSRYPRLPKAT